MGLTGSDGVQVFEVSGDGACAMRIIVTGEGAHASVPAAPTGTKAGDGSLGDHWAPWWRARATEGYEFASHTWNHVYWRGDVAGDPPRFHVRPFTGPKEGVDETWTAAQYCEELGRPQKRLEQITGKKPLPLFRAPGGKTSQRLLAAAQACGYKHVGWSPAGFLGDELP